MRESERTAEFADDTGEEHRTDRFAIEPSNQLYRRTASTFLCSRGPTPAGCAWGPTPRETLFLSFPAFPAFLPFPPPPALFVSQRQQRIDPARPASRNQSRHHRHWRPETRSSRRRSSDRSAGCRTAAKTRTVRARAHAGMPTTRPTAARISTSFMTIQHDLGRLRRRARGGCQALSSAARRRERHHAVEADRREQRREQTEARRQHRDQRDP